LAAARGRKKRSKKNKRKADEALRKKKSLLSLRVAGILILSGGLFWAAVLGFQVLEQAEVFEVREVRWIGLVHFKEAEMQARFKEILGKNLFQVNIRALQKALIADPWIQAATVKKQFPDRLVILVRERKAAAVGYEGKVEAGMMRVDLSSPPALIDSEGRVLSIGSPYPLGLPQVIHFKRAAYGRALRLGRLLLKAFGRRSNKALIDLSDPEDLRVYLDAPDGHAQGLLHFGKEAYAARWRRFLAIEDDLQKRGLRRWEVDLRFSDKVVLKASRALAQGLRQG